MKKILVLLFVSVVSVSCNKDAATCTGATTQSETDGSSTSTSSPTTCPNDTTTPPVTGDTGTTDGSTGTGLPNEAYTFETNILFVSTTPEQQDKFDKAVEMIKKVVATEEFRTKVLNHTYNGQKTFVDNGGFSNAQIYQQILEAAETLQPVKNNTMDMEVELYFEASSTVGYTYPNTKRIFVNTKYFNTNSVGGVAQNLFHEWLHKIGFKHAVAYSSSRDFSVPYAIGRMIQTLGSGL